ncbi:MAG: hypothetical protein PHY64_00275 [Eubacteriales bacterium]|nr:hypothetical protein [Eubacteriales bacterium]
MILDTGICTIFRRYERSFTLVCKSWYGELSYETQPSQGNRNVGTQTDARVRIQQERTIVKGDVAVLRDTEALADTVAYYEVTRAYHGADDHNGQPITDLTLKETQMTERPELVPGVEQTDSMAARKIVPGVNGRRAVAAEVQTISAEEHYEAMAYGEKPEIRLLIYADDYAGEPFILLANTMYRIQHREKDGKRLALTCGEART